MNLKTLELLFKCLKNRIVIECVWLLQAAREDAEDNGSSPAKAGVGVSSRLAARRRTEDAGKKRLLEHSTAMEAIQAQSDPIDNVDHLP